MENYYYPARKTFVSIDEQPFGLHLCNCTHKDNVKSSLNDPGVSNTHLVLNCINNAFR